MGGQRDVALKEEEYIVSESSGESAYSYFQQAMGNLEISDNFIFLIEMFLLIKHIYILSCSDPQRREI